MEVCDAPERVLVIAASLDTYKRCTPPSSIFIMTYPDGIKMRRIEAYTRSRNVML